MFLSAIITTRGRNADPGGIGKCLESLLPLAESLPQFCAVLFAGKKDDADIPVPAGFGGKFRVVHSANVRKAVTEFIADNSGSFCMFLGADSRITRHDDIIRFFASGECEDYNSAALNIRRCGRNGIYENYSAAVLRIPADISDEDIRLMRGMYLPPVRLLDTRIITGDAPGDGDFPLSSLRYLGYAEALRGSDRENAYRHISAGMYLCPEKRRSELIPFYVMRAQLLLEDGAYDDVIDLCEKYFGENFGYALSDAEIYCIMGKALSALGRKAGAAAAFEKYLGIYPQVIKGGFGADNVICPSAEVMPVCAALCAEEAAAFHIGRNECEAAGYVLDMIPISCFRDDALEARLELETVICDNTGYERAEDIFRRLPRRKRRIFSEIIRKKLAASADKKDYSAQLSDMYFDDPLIEDITAIYSAHFSCGTAEMFEKADISQYPELLFFALTEGTDISAKVSEDFNKTALAVDFIFENFPEAAQVFAGYSADCGSSMTGLSGLTLCFERAAHYAVHLGESRCAAVLFEMFCGYGARLASAELECDVLSEDEPLPDNIPAALRKYIFGARAVRCLGYHDYKGSVEALREMIAVSPESAYVIGAYNDNIRLTAAKREWRIRRSEMDMFSRTAKENIRYRLEHGDYANAIACAAEYTRINPLDPDINSILAESGLYIADDANGIKQ